jgi:hypothetical protein
LISAAPLVVVGVDWLIFCGVQDIRLEIRITAIVKIERNFFISSTSANYNVTQDKKLLPAHIPFVSFRLQRSFSL